jgi:hypothetical protein
MAECGDIDEKRREEGKIRKRGRREEGKTHLHPRCECG